MRAKNSRMMRCLALLLAVLLVVPAMSVSAFASNEGHIHNHADEHQTLGQLIVSNYGDVVVNGDYQQITAAEKVILNSGALLIDPEFDVDTPLGTGNVTLNAVDMSITAKVIEDNANNCVWIPVDAGVYVDGVERERVALTPDGAGNYAGHYTFDGSAFYVVVNYQLVKTLTAEEKQNIVDLLNIAYELSLDLDVINLLVSNASVELVGSSRTPLNVLSALTDTTIGAAMGLEDGDTIIDLIYKISEGTLSQTIELPFESEELGSNEFEILIEMRTGSSGKPARDAAAALKGQMDANGGKLDLSQFFASHSLHSYLEIVGKHSDELDTMLDALYTNLSNINGSRGLGWTIGELGVVIEDTIPAIKEEAVDWINEQLTALQAEYPEAGIELIASLDDLAKVVENLKAERAGMLNLINKTLAQISAMYPAAGLPASVSTVEELQALKNTLTQAGLASNPMFASFVASLDAAIEALPVFDAAIANMEKGMSLSELDALQNTLDALELLNEVLDATCVALEPVVDNAGQWKTGTYLSSENSAVYTSIMNAVTEAAKADAIRLYAADDIAGELVIAEGADQANMSMSDVTITVELNVVDATNNYFTHSLKKVITVEDGTTAAELKSAVTKFETEAVEQWTAAGIFVEGKYVCSNVEIPDVITGADSVVVTYDPAKFTVDMLGQVSEKDYGWTISLPIHPDSTKAYDYMVNGVHYMQGSSLIVKNDLVITREEGDGYTAEKLFPMVSARFDEYLKLISTANAADGIARVKAIINSGALGIENTNIYVRYPKNCVAIAGVENSNDYIVTAQPYEAVYNGAEWIPVSVTVFEGVNGQTSRVVTDCNEVGGAYEFVFTSNTMHHVVVNYSLSLADLGLTDEYVKDTMNEIMEVYNDVVDQLNDLQYLVNTLEYLKKLNSTVLENAKNLTDNPDTIAAIDQMMANNLDVNGNMILTTYLNDYLTGTPKGLEYYYANFSIIDAEVQSLKGPMEILGKDTALLAELDAFEPGIGDKVGSVTETIVAIDLTGPDENLNNIGLTNLLNAIGPSTNSNATFTELPYLEAGDALPGGEMTLESSLSLAGPGMVKVVINVTVVDIFKNRTTQSTTPITITAGDKLTTEQINALIAAVEAINPNVRNHDPMDDPETVEVEPLYSEAGLRELLAAELEEDLVISFYWERFHDCEFTAPTCTQASYCIYCKVVKGEPDTVNGHTWDAGVESLAPTCEKTGLTLFTCAECGGTTTEAIPALGHVFGEYISDGNVTCSTLGTKTAYCTREGCNIYDRVVDEETPLLPHTLSGWSKVDGGIYHTRSCHDCDYTETAAHNWDAEGVVYAEKAPTCTESGWRTFTCSDCGETKDEVEPATGHDFDYEDSDNTWVSSSAGHARPCKNGCGALGTTHAHTFPDTPCDEKSACDVCGYIKPAGEHKWGAWVKVDEHTHERTCPTCGDVETASHNWDDGVVTTAPTCTEKGEKTYTCNDCGATYTEEVEPTGHSYVPVVTAPTCTEQGYTTFTCSVCGHSYKDDYVDATGHSYGDWTVTVEPTCTEPGEKRRFCGKCGSYETEEIPAAGHNYIPVVTDPTCTEEGYTTYTCSVCGDTYVDDYVGTTDHEYGDWYETLAPTCTEPGEERRDCEHCTAFETREVPAAGHSYDSVVTPPTCTEQGYTTYTCHCGDSYVADYVDATGHDFGDWYETLAPTCSAKGEERRDCKNGCGEFETREVPMVDHNFASGIYLQSADGHAEKCTECDAYGPVKAHTWNTNDCEATDAECTVCHYVRTAGAHSWSDWTKVDNDKHERFCSVCSEREEANHTPKNEGVVTTEPTCSEPGVRTHTCFDCGDTYTEEIPATGIHVYDKTQDPIVVTDPTCDTVGEAYYPCIYGCGEKEMVEIPATGHDWDDGVETTAPDCENPGVKTYTCRNDATHTYTEEIPALGHDYQVTGTYDEDGHEVKCSRCGDTITVDHEWEKVGAAQDGIQAYKCICGAEKTENVKPEVPETGNLDDFNHTWDRTNEILKVDVPDTNGNYKYAFDYTIYMGTYGGASTYSLRARAGTPIVLTIRVNSGNEFYTINLNNLLAEQYPELFGGPANADALADFVYNAWKNPDSVVITCELVDLSENELVNFVSGLNAGSSSALKFSLVQNADGSYTIVANVANADGIQGAFVNVATALVFNGIYNKIGMKSWAEDGGYETVFGNGQLSIQALINGFLYEDGFGTGTIVNAFTETGAINPAAIHDYDSFLVGSQSSVGALIQTAHMSLGNSTEIKYEVDFHLTMSQGSGQLLEVRNLLDTAEPILTAETRRGKMQVTLKEKIYEIYQAEMLLTGGADKNQPVIATNEDACKYLHEYLKVLMGKNVNVSTYENTLEKLGQSRDLSKYASILNLVIDEFGKAQLSSDCLSINLARNAKTTIDKLMSKFNIAMNTDLLGAIKEYGDPNLDLSVVMTAVFEPAEVQFGALIIDLDNNQQIAGVGGSQYLNKFDFAKIGEVTSRINTMADRGAVMLFADVNGNLVFNGDAILDLNGKTINGNIVANGKLFIVDSSMDTTACGMVNGSVTTGKDGVVYITGGKFRDTLPESYLKNGYVQGSDKIVVNELYTITEKADGEYTITLHSSFATKPSKDMGLALGIDLLTDMLLNDFEFGAMTITGGNDYEVYNITLNELLSLYAGTERIDQAIGAVVEDVDFENIRLFINDLLAGVLDFESIAATYEDTDSANDGVVVEYTLKGNHWDIVPEHVVGEDYIEFHLEVNAASSETKTLTVVIDGEMAEALFAELGEIADATATVDTLDVVYNNQRFDIGLVGNADVTLNLTGSAEKHDTYVAVIAVVLAKVGNTDLLNVLNANGNTDAQYAAFNNVSVKDVISALKAIDADTDFADLAAEVGLANIDSAEMDALNTAYQALGYTAGALLNHEDITGSSTQKMGALDPDGDGTYVFDDFATNAYTDSLNKTKKGFTVSVDGAMTAKLTLNLFEVCDHVGGTATCKTQAVCDICGCSYGELDANNHEGTTKWVKTAEKHSQVYTCCGAVAMPETDHVWTTKEDVGKGHYDECTICYYRTATVGHNDANGDHVCDDCQAVLGHTCSYTWYDNMDGLTHTGVCRYDSKHTVIGYHNYGYDNVCDYCGFVKDGHCPSCEDDGCHTEEFQDLNSGAWYHEYTDYVICKGIMIGISTTEKIFDPTGITTRAMLVTTLYRDYLSYGGTPVASTGEMPFDDVAKGAWYTDAVIWAAQNGIVLGYGNGKFGPSDTLTREQSATIFYRYAKFCGFDSEFDEGCINTFDDYDQVSSWAEDGVKWAVTQKMMNGRGSASDATLSPDSDLQRAEIAALLYRWFVLFED